MARSEEAILRRALKRDRTEGQQRHADRMDMNRQAQKQKVLNESNNSKLPRKQDRKEENSCQRSQTFRQDRRNAGLPNKRIPKESRRKPPNKKRPRHDEETSKKLVWADQASSTTLMRNQDLRKRYRETNGEGMDAKDVERAKLLIARDERKRQKKKRKSSETETDTKESTLSNSVTNEEDKTSTGKDRAITEESVQHQQPLSHNSNSKKRKKLSDAQSRRDQNKALRQLYLTTNGKGMKEDQIERAKLLIARDIKKKQKKKAEKETAQKQ